MENRIEIELTDEIAEGIYSNLAIISHSQSEFVVDFVRLVPGVQKAKVKTRVLLTPDRAKALLYALQENINKFENSYGKIKSEKGNGPVMPINFNGGPEA